MGLSSSPCKLLRFNGPGFIIGTVPTPLWDVSTEGAPAPPPRSRRGIDKPSLGTGETLGAAAGRSGLGLAMPKLEVGLLGVSVSESKSQERVSSVDCVSGVASLAKLDISSESSVDLFEILII